MRSRLTVAQRLATWLLFVALVTGCGRAPFTPTTPTPAPSPALKATPSAIALRQQTTWNSIKSIATRANPIIKNNPTSEWMETVLVEDVSFLHGLEIRLDVKSKGVGGVLFVDAMTDSMPGVPWWRGVKRLELLFENGGLNILLRDGSQEAPVYSKQIPLDPGGGNVVLTFDQQARNIDIQQDDKTLLRIVPAAVGNFANGLFPDGRILDVEFTDGPNSNSELTELELLVPISDYVAPVPTNAPTVGLPGPLIPQGLGVNIHFLTGHPSDLDAIAKAGIQIVRIDVPWSDIESSRGVYDFTVTDAFMDATRRRKLRALFLFSSGNRLYDDGLAPHSAEGRAAFAHFAAVIAARYSGQGVLWDLWGEPNLEWSWKPKPNVQDYAKLALATIESIRTADPGAVIVGPGICCFEDPHSWSFYDELGKLGVLAKFDVVSIHDYNDPILKPEEVPTLYAHLRQILNAYSPGKKIPIAEDEFGYSTTWPGINAERQAQYLARLWLINLANGVNLSIWYDWKDDGPDKNNPEHNFGITDQYAQAKPAYLAAQTFAQTLAGYQFERRIATPNGDDYLLVFTKGGQLMLALWTAGVGHSISLPLPGTTLSVMSMLGQRSTVVRSNNGVVVQVDGSPQYLFLGTQRLP